MKKAFHRKPRPAARGCYTQGIAVKKKYSQNFLRDHAVTTAALAAVALEPHSNVFEIGCGDGFLTRDILEKSIGRLWAFEIDQEWVHHITSTILDPRLTVFHTNILDYDFREMEDYKPWILVANLPYQVTFPILYKLQHHRALIQEGVVMVQEEVAQKIVKTTGRGYGHTSLFLQRYFDWKLLSKVPPGAFYPAPKVFSRLLHFKTRKTVAPIIHEREFWQFVKMCFHQPRRTLKNNLAQSSYRLDIFSDELLGLRAQQLNFQDFLEMWNTITLYHIANPN